MTITKIRRERLTLPATGFLVPCPVCRRDVEVLSLSQAAAILDVTEESLQALLTSGAIHEVEPIFGAPRICRISLLAISPRNGGCLT